MGCFLVASKLYEAAFAPEVPLAVAPVHFTALTAAVRFVWHLCYETRVYKVRSYYPPVTVTSWSALRLATTVSQRLSDTSVGFAGPFDDKRAVTNTSRATGFMGPNAMPGGVYVPTSTIFIWEQLIKMPSLKRVPKRDLCALIRYLNFYELVRRRIHYFSIRVKQDLIHDLGVLYRITPHEDRVEFVALRGDLPSFAFVYEGRAWQRNGEAIKLPKSRKQCVRRMAIHRTRVTLKWGTNDPGPGSRSRPQSCTPTCVSS